MAEFKSFTEIKKFKGVHVVITEKIHGTNAQILVEDQEVEATEEHPAGTVRTVLAGSRTRWVTPFSDNYGFAAWVKANEAALAGFLGRGRHFGEWYGAGINHGYGLKEKRLALFNTRRYEQLAAGVALPERVDLVPVLYDGGWRPDVIDECLVRLQREGSILAPGCMKVEGVVVHFPQFDSFAKCVISPEETGWRSGGSKDPNAPKKPTHEETFAAAAEYLQPIRLEKLLSRDEVYVREYPASLPTIVRDYLADLEKEGCAPTEEKEAAVKKAIFPWIKATVPTLAPNA